MTTRKVLCGKNNYFHVVGVVVFCGWSSFRAIDDRLPFMNIHPPHSTWAAEQIATGRKEIGPV